MPKAPAGASDSARRTIPSVSESFPLLRSRPRSANIGRERVKEAVAEHLATLRAHRADTTKRTRRRPPLPRSLAAATGSTLRRTINGSGVIIHTNLGRSPIDAADLGRGGRARHRLLESRIRSR